MTAPLAFLLGLIIALPLAFLIDWVRRWWRFETLIRHIETPRDFQISNCEILPPHKPAARPSNVRTLVTKPNSRTAA